MCVCIYCLKRISSPKKKNLSSYTYPHVAWNPYDFSFFLSPVELRRFKIDSRRAGCLKTCDKRRFGKPVNHFSYLKRLFGPYLWLAFKVNSPKNETTSDIVYSSLCHYTFLVCKIATKILQDLLSFTKIFNTDLVKPKAWIFLTEHILCIQFCVMDGCVKVTFLSFRHSGIYITPLWDYLCPTHQTPLRSVSWGERVCWQAPGLDGVFPFSWTQDQVSQFSQHLLVLVNTKQAPSEGVCTNGAKIRPDRQEY